MVETDGPIIKESENLIKNTQEWQSIEGHRLSDEDDAGYGHALRSLGARVDANREVSPEEQREYLRIQAFDLIDRFGEKIKKVMKPELLEALDMKDH